VDACGQQLGHLRKRGIGRGVHHLGLAKQAAAALANAAESGNTCTSV